VYMAECDSACKLNIFQLVICVDLAQ
jgi:hypothetical protein